MKNQNVLIALIVAGAMVISAAIVSSGLKSLGDSVLRAGSSIGSGMAARRTSIPSSFRVDLGELKIANGGGGGGSFRVQQTGK